ncbi:MAG TPA: sensor histidine kinase, partial [Ktedonobacter sp.]|nr:sensor histidine kinase [Ktedonobacter sp.]
QRQQTKWVVFGMTVAVLGFAATISVGTTLFPADARSGPFETMIAYTALDLFLLLIPFSIGLAILRSRLWEIDVIINRSLVYGTLTVSLALIYVGSVLALQTLLGSFTEGNQFAIVGSTLVIAVLFQPLRRRIQAIIDL